VFTSLYIHIYEYTCVLIFAYIYRCKHSFNATLAATLTSTFPATKRGEREILVERKRERERAHVREKRSEREIEREK